MTDNSIEEFDFSGSQGAEHAQEAMKGGDFEREIMFLSLDGSASGKAQGKDNITIRFVTDSTKRHNDPLTRFNLSWITVAGHYASTKPKPEYVDEKRQWPQKMGAGCRKDPVFAAKYNGQCYICDVIGSKPSKRVWALAVERIEVKDDNGATIGWADKTREVFARDADGKGIVIGQKDGKDQYEMKTVPAWILISQGWKNFFQPLSGQVSYFQRQGGSGLLDGDWNITRTGTDNNDTSYSAIRVAEQFLPDELAEQWGLPKGSKYDLSMKCSDGTLVMEKVYPDMPDLRRQLADRVAEHHFGYYFVPGYTPPDWDPSKAKSSGGDKPKAASHGMVMGSAPSAPATSASEEPPTEALDALKNRLVGS